MKTKPAPKPRGGARPGAGRKRGTRRRICFRLNHSTIVDLRARAGFSSLSDYLEHGIPSLCATVFQFARLWDWPAKPANSADMQDLTIKWALEFELKYSGTVWGTDLDWLPTLEKFFNKRWEEWLHATPAIERTEY